MKINIIATIFLTSSCLGADSPDIVSKVTQLDRNKDGMPEVRYERIYRGTNEVLGIMQSTKRGNIRSTARSYKVSGDILMIEEDKDGDGIYERIVLYHPVKRVIEAFSRQTDGSVKPVDSKVLEAYRNQDAAISDFWDKAVTNANELSDLMQKTRKKIQDSEKEVLPTFPCDL